MIRIVILYLVIIHTITFINEYLYRQVCVNFSFLGFFTSIYTSQTELCLTMRSINTSAIGFVYGQTCLLMMNVFGLCVYKLQHMRKMTETLVKKICE